MELIDKQELLDWIQNCWDWATVDGITSTTVLKQTMTDISQLPTVEAIPKADYENRLKADLVAMLTELSMKIGEIEDGYVEFDEENKRSLTMIPLESVERLIDEEINSLKEA